MTRNFEDHLWREFVRVHGDDLAQSRPATKHGLRRPRVVAGAGLGLAGGATALALVLTVSGAPPAFAVTLNHNGTVTVTIRGASAISGVNAEPHQLGIPAKVASTAPADCQAQSAQPQSSQVPTGTRNTLGTGSTTWTFNRSVVAGPAQTVVLTPSSAGNSGTTGSSGSGPNWNQIWTCGNQQAVAKSSPAAGGNSGGTGEQRRYRKQRQLAPHEPGLLAPRTEAAVAPTEPDIKLPITAVIERAQLPPSIAAGSVGSAAGLGDPCPPVTDF